MMKSIFITLLLCIVGICYLHGQQLCASYDVNFEDDGSWCNVIFQVDTISNPINIWEIGSPNKTGFDSAYSYPNVIITDRLKPDPANDILASL